MRKPKTKELCGAVFGTPARHCTLLAGHRRLRGINGHWSDEKPTYMADGREEFLVLLDARGTCVSVHEAVNQEVRAISITGVDLDTGSVHLVPQLTAEQALRVAAILTTFANNRGER